MSRLEDAIAAGRFVVTAELLTVNSGGLDAVQERFAPYADWVDAVNATDNTAAHAHASPLAVAIALRQLGMEPVMQLVCRDRNRLALEAEIAGAGLHGIENICCLTGDDVTAGDEPEARRVFDLDSIQLLATASAMASGTYLSGRKIEPPPRPDNPPAPAAIQAREQEYINRLLLAYASRLRRAVACVGDIQTDPQLHGHFRRSRGFFFAAEALARFSRDHFPAGSFDGVKQHVHDGVVDLTLATHADGFECVLAVARLAVALHLPQSDLLPYVAPADRVGMCHHLANDGHLKWVQ